MEVRIRNVENWVIEWHRQHAKREGRSLESKLRELLTAAAASRKRELVGRMGTDLEALRAAHGTLPDSATLIREEREQRG